MCISLSLYIYRYIYICIHIYIYIYIKVNLRSRLREFGAEKYNHLVCSTAPKTPYCRTKRSISLFWPLRSACALDFAAPAHSEPPKGAWKRCSGSLGAADCPRKRCSSSLGTVCALEFAAPARSEPLKCVENTVLSNKSFDFTVLAAPELLCARFRCSSSVRATKGRSKTLLGLPRSRRLPSKMLLELARNRLCARICCSSSLGAIKMRSKTSLGLPRSRQLRSKALLWASGSPSRRLRSKSC